MKIIVDEAGEIITKTTDDHTLIGGHHRLAVAASLGKRLFWRDTGEPVKLDLFFKHEVLFDIRPEPRAEGVHEFTGEFHRFTLHAAPDRLLHR